MALNRPCAFVQPFKTIDVQMIDASSTSSDILSQLIRSRRSVRDFLPQEIPDELLEKILADANWSPSWSNT